MSFSEELRELRKSAKLTQKEFAQELCLSPNTINQAETGARLPKMITMKHIYDYCAEKGLDSSRLRQAWLDERTEEK